MAFRLFPGGRGPKVHGSDPKRLDTGDSFPRLSWKTVDEENLVVPDAFKGRWAVILFYRGHW